MAPASTTGNLAGNNNSETMIHATSRLNLGLPILNECSRVFLHVTKTSTGSAVPVSFSATETAYLAFSSAVSNPLHVIRGGASTVDFSRESLSLQGIGSYVSIAALIMNASLRLWTSTKFSEKQNKVVSNVFNVATALCITSGAFTAIIFQLLTIYGKAALGVGNDGGYIAFKSATAAFRVWGFRSFLVNMLTFVVSFMSQMYNTLWEDARHHNHKSALTATGKFIMGGSVIFMMTGCSAIYAVLSLASQHVFSTNDFMPRLG